MTPKTKSELLEWLNVRYAPKEMRELVQLGFEPHEGWYELVEHYWGLGYWESFWWIVSKGVDPDDMLHYLRREQKP